MIVLHAYPPDDRPLRMFTTVVFFLIFFFKKAPIFVLLLHYKLSIERARYGFGLSRNCILADFPAAQRKDQFPMNSLSMIMIFKKRTQKSKP